MIGSQRDLLAAQALGDAIDPTMQKDLPLGLDASHGIAGVVIDRRERFGKGSLTGAITLRGYVEVERVVRALVVVHLSPLSKVMLAVRDAAETMPFDEFSLERSMKAFILAEGLWMTGS